MFSLDKNQYVYINNYHSALPPLAGCHSHKLTSIAIKNMMLQALPWLRLPLLTLCCAIEGIGGNGLF